MAAVKREFEKACETRDKTAEELLEVFDDYEHREAIFVALFGDDPKAA